MMSLPVLALYNEHNFQSLKTKKIAGPSDVIEPITICNLQEIHIIHIY